MNEGQARISFVPTHVAVICHDGPDSQAARKAAAQDHLRYVQTVLDHLALAGPLFSPDGQRMIGSLYVFKTGSLDEARRWLERAGRDGVPVDDLLATLVALSVRAVAIAWRQMAGSDSARGGERILVGGGGVRNRFGMESLARAMEGVPVEPMEAAGVPADAAEAMAFSLLARNALLGIPNQLPQCTGVREARVLGVVHGVEWLRG